MKTIVFLSLLGVAACATSGSDPTDTSAPPEGDVSPSLPPSTPAAPTPPASATGPAPAPTGSSDPDKSLASCSSGYPKQYIHCDGTSNVRTLSTAIFPTDRVSAYPCAAGEVAHETALEFDPPAGSVVTVNLVVTDSVDADLDLIVLDNLCYGKAACMNAGADGVTLGTGTESVTFTAQASHKYFVVIDGKAATPANFKVSVSCN